jgi:iron-sulfur cluster assembly protein
MITITEQAAQKIKTIAQEQGSEGKFVRVYAESGCCCGPKFGLAFDDKQSDDQLIQHDGVQVVVDAQSAKLLEGAVVDYVRGEQGEGFQIRGMAAPKEEGGGCGCGHSHDH